jgi:hypothetical protein
MPAESRSPGRAADMASQRYYASVPADSPLRFPGICPFTGLADPKGKVRLARTDASSSEGLLALLHVSLLFVGLHLSRLRTRSLRVPADHRFARKAGIIEFVMWACCLGAVAALVVFFIRSQSYQSLAGSGACLLGAVVAAAFFKLWHYRLLRPVALGDASDYFIEIGFLSEPYAQEFASLNKVFLELR